MGNKKIGDSLESLAKEHALYPQESLLRIKNRNKSLYIGVPKEKEELENRVPLTPESVEVLVNNGHHVMIESSAGSPSSYTDREYSEAGAKIVYSDKEAFENDIIIKIAPPTIEEIGYMSRGASLISALQLARLKVEIINELNKKKITSLAFEYLEDKGGTKPVVRAMSEIAGSCIVSIAGEYLTNSNQGKGVIFGGITGVPPTKVVILGAGTIGEYVTRAARGMGAVVRVFDNHHYKLRRLKTELGEHIYTSIIDQHVLSKELEDADVVVGALRSEDGLSPCVVTEDMVSHMKPNAVIIDASISQGGCFETSHLTSHRAPVFRKYDVIHYCVPNIPSRVSRTAAQALSHIFTPILLQIADAGSMDEMMANKEWFMQGIYTYKGYLTRDSLAKKFGIACKELELLLAARF